MASILTSTVARDVAYQLHPFTNLRRHESEGPLVITGGRGIYVCDETGASPGSRARTGISTCRCP